jgi:competence protein ComFB
MDTKPSHRPHNIREDQVFQVLDDMLRNKPEVCGCDRCRTDMAVFALNRLQPAYVATGLGETLSRVHAEEDQSRAQAAAQVAMAIKIIARNPRHEPLTAES